MNDRCKFCGYYGKHTAPCYEQLAQEIGDHKVLMEEAIQILMVVVDCDCQEEVTIKDIRILLKQIVHFKDKYKP